MESIVEQSEMSLHDSPICRLCAEENSNGYPLFCKDGKEPDISALINAYLPVKPKISDDGKLPKWICPGCHLQVESTVQFFDLVVCGQEKLQGLCARDIIPVKTPGKSSVDQNVGVARKRGRPAKLATAPIYAQEDCAIQHVSTEIESAHRQYNEGRKRRKIITPSRYRSSVQGKELEKILFEKGVLEHTEFTYDADETVREFAAGRENQTVYPVEVIGHLQDNNGATLGDLVVINNKYSKMYKKSKMRRTRFMCDICKMCFTYELKFLQHRLSHQNVKFECTQCLKSFTERNSLNKHHLETQHSGEGIIECIELAPATFDLDSDTLTDRSSMDPTDVFISSLAQKDVNIETFISDEKICKNNYEHNILNEERSRKSNETVNVHSQNKADVCKVGSKENLNFDRNTLVQDNVEKNSVHRLRYTCNICNAKFSRIQIYITHRENEHNVGRRFVCSKCKKCFKSKSMVQRHQLVHSNTRPYSCNYCNAAFKTKTHLFYHKRSHTGEKKHKCDICQQLFAHKNSLTLHLRSHTGYKPFKCSVCDKTFTQHGNMQEHMRIHTGECPFECHICGRKFKTSSQVRMHIKRHEVDKPLKCNLCDKSFVQVVELSNHQRRHNNIRPYSCEFCGKCFIDGSSLKKHLRLHTGEKPYACIQCPRKFADQSNLKKHLKIHENKTKEMEFWHTTNIAKSSGFDESFNDCKSAPVADLDNAHLNSMVEDSSVWNLIEEDVYFGEDSSPCSPSKAIVKDNQQLMNITYQDPSNPLVGKTTLFVLQSSPGSLSSKATTSLESSMVLENSLNNEQLLQPSNIFLASPQDGTNDFQTVILNIQNPASLGESCGLLRSGSSTDLDFRLITSDQHNSYSSSANTLSIPKE